MAVCREPHARRGRRSNKRAGTVSRWLRAVWNDYVRCESSGEQRKDRSWKLGERFSGGGGLRVGLGISLGGKKVRPGDVDLPAPRRSRFALLCVARKVRMPYPAQRADDGFGGLLRRVLGDAEDAARFAQ